MENIHFIYPEIFLSIIAMLLLMVGVFNQKAPMVNLLNGISAFTILVAVYMFYAIDFKSNGQDIAIFNGAFDFSDFSIYMKRLACLAAIATCVISVNNKSFANGNPNCFEYPILILLSLVGACLLISANDLIAVYMGLELLSLSSYVLVAINRDNSLSSEAAVKYFVLGALASGLILFGSSLIYGFSGSTNISEIYSVIANNEELKTSGGLVLGLVLVFSGFLFKISAAPMHMWAPDVYEGVSKPVLSYLSTVPKIAAIAFIIRIVASQPEVMQGSFSMIIVVISILSLLVGSFAGLKQSNFKRLLAYSSIANMGFLLIAIAVATPSAMSSALLYLTIYIVTLIGVFAILTKLNKDETIEDKISNFAGLGKTNPVFAGCLAVLILSLAGIPPMAGFLAKFFVFIEAIESANYTLAVIGVLASVVACFYYLKIIKTMYFDEPNNHAVITRTTNTARLLIFISVLFSLLALFFIDNLLQSASVAISTIL